LKRECVGVALLAPAYLASVSWAGR